MTFRIFSHKHQLYTNSLNWPSNQRTWSEWALSPNGEVLEMIHGDDSGSCSVEKHDKRNFSIEPWTGFYDCQNKKIYLGDIIKLQCFNLDYEIVWYIDRFTMKPLFETFGALALPEYNCFREQKDFSVDWLVTNTIHGVEFDPI